MNIRNIAGVALLVVAVALAIQLVQQSQVKAKPTPIPQKAAGVKYAILEVLNDGSSVSWRPGGNLPVRTESVRAAFQRFGGTGPSEFTDLLNQIGSRGWQLVEKDGNLWIFSQ